MSRLLPLLLLLVGCATDVQAPFIATQDDFADYRSWTAFDRGDDPVPPTHDAASFIYIDALPPSGATAFPVGTIIVRTEQIDVDPTTWQLHAMVKRGDGFNPDGAVGWEFFELSHIDDGPPVIVWRGEGPPDGDGYRPPDGSDAVLGCNHCHGAFPDNDSVLDPVLDLSTL